MRESAAIRPSRWPKISHKWVERPFDVSKLERHDIIITRNKSFISAGISFFSYGFPAHTDWYMDDGKGEIIGATTPRCRKTIIGEYIALQKEDKVRLTAVRLNPEIIEKVGEDVWNLVDPIIYNSVGKKYGWKKIAELGLYSILTLGFLSRGKKYRKVLNDYIDEPICSELIERGCYPIAERIKNLVLTGQILSNGNIIEEDLFPSQLLPYASPFDLYDSWSTQYVTGWERIACNKKT